MIAMFRAAMTWMHHPRTASAEWCSAGYGTDVLFARLNEIATQRAAEQREVAA